MIRIFYLENNQLHWEKHQSLSTPVQDGRHILWVDLQSPTPEESKQIENQFGIEFYTPQEAAEIESSSRYFEDSTAVEANNVFVVYEEQSYVPRQVSFILHNDILFTLRNADLKSFGETVRKIKTFKRGALGNGFQIWLLLIENQIDREADFIENLTRLTNMVSRNLVIERSIQEETLLKITQLQENTIVIRESIVDKQRLVSSLMKSAQMTEPEIERLRIIIKDINSLLQHVQFSFERLEYLQNTFLGLINIEQNKVIKIFTVVTVVFMPPTLIASIYGMNFRFMPELDWVAGYPFALGLMVISSFAFLWYFKRKNWL